jgi:hypothetical protein
MADTVRCNECHARISQGHSLSEVKGTCVQCHEARYGKMTDKWQQEVSERMKKLELSLKTLTFGKKTPDPEKRKTEILVKEVEDLLKAIHQDKSKGVHNFIYAQKLLSKAEEKVFMAKRFF